MDKELLKNIEGHLQEIRKQQGELLEKMDCLIKLSDHLVTTNKYLAEIKAKIPERIGSKQKKG